MLTVFPSVGQYRSEYVILTPDSWTESWVVISAPTSSTITIDGDVPAACVNVTTGEMSGVTYSSHTCQVNAGVHTVSGDEPFGVISYGYGSAGSYALVGGANVNKIYAPPPATCTMITRWWRSTPVAPNARG